MNNKISIIYINRNSDYFDESLNSVLSQSYVNFELILIDNNSIIKPVINDNRIKYIKFKEEAELAVCKNHALSKASGDLIIFMDQNIKFISNDYFNSIKDFNGDILFNQSKLTGKLNFTKVHDVNFFKDNFQLLSGCVFTKNALFKLPYFFEQYYPYNEDLKFLCTCLSHNLHIECNNNKVYDIIYNINYRYPDIKEKVFDRINKLYSLNSITSELSVVLAFYNENMEVEKTVQSIRATSKKFINIILVDDFSDDGYDYESIAKIYNCEYYKLDKCQGPSVSKNYGVEKVKTKYFILLDAHMRFYNNDWDEHLIKYGLEKYNNTIFVVSVLHICVDGN